MRNNKVVEESRHNGKAQSPNLNVCPPGYGPRQVLPPFSDLNFSAASQASAAGIAGRRLSTNVYPPGYGLQNTGVVSLFDSFPGLSHVLPPFPDLNPSAASQASAAGIAGRRLSSNFYPPGYGPQSIGAVSLFDSFPGSSHVLPPFPGLNPSAAFQAFAGGIPGRRLTPKLEVKEEPLDERRTQDPSNHISLHGGLSDAFILPPPPPSSSNEVSAIGSKFGDNRVSTYVLRPRPPPRIRRPCELARVTNIGREHQETLKRTRMIYDSLRLHLMAENMKRPETQQRRRYHRTDIEASYMMRDCGLWLNQEKHIVGAVPGVEIGDVFFHRMEMCVVGLHGQPQAGIDFLTADRSSNGEPIATSIVVSGGYDDNEDTGNVLVYAGQGGQDRKLLKQCQDQKLETGNLAMERSMYHRIEVRVIRGHKHPNIASTKVYIYDGLYRIVDYWLAEGKSGFRVFKFKLVRIEGQPEMGSVTAKLAETLKSSPLIVRPSGYKSLDISSGKENVPVYVYNDLDGDLEPLCKPYIAKSFYSPEISVLVGNNRTGCNCYNDSCTENCFCAWKNGGEFAYDDKGILLRGKPAVFECGIFCKCGPGCKNRVSQKGLRNRLEVFRLVGNTWGVRTLDVIHAGAFICEYAGAIVTRSQAEIMSMNGGDAMVCPDMFADKWGKWGDLSQVYPDYARPDYPSLPPLDFRIDVSVMSNVACYMSHSRAPNVMGQFVLYDHDDLRFPRIMLFALENIPALTELSLDYGFRVG